MLTIIEKFVKTLDPALFGSALYLTLLFLAN